MGVGKQYKAALPEETISRVKRLLKVIGIKVKVFPVAIVVKNGNIFQKFINLFLVYYFFVVIHFVI